MKTGATLAEKVERVTGRKDLIRTLLKIKPGTWQTSKQVYAAWQAGAPVVGVFTADMAYYEWKKNQAILYLCRLPGNLLNVEAFRDKAYHEIKYNDYFVLPRNMEKYVRSAIKSGPCLRVDLKDLMLEFNSDGTDYIDFAEDNTSLERKIFRHVFGRDVYNVDNLDERKKISLLRDFDFKDLLEYSNHRMIARMCYLNKDLEFSACISWQDIKGNAVRGVPLSKVAIGDAQKKAIIHPDYQKVLADIAQLSDLEKVRLYDALTDQVSEIAIKNMQK